MTTLLGGCACGRNKYAIHVPEKSDELAQVIYSNSSHSRHLQAAPFTAFLKIPVPWFESATIAYYPDETHQSIRKSFYSPTQQHLQNQFCGYCGTQITQFNSESKAHDQYIWVTIGSLDDEDLDLLEELGCLDLDAEREETDEQSGGMDVMDLQRQKASSALFGPAEGLSHRGAPWFETVVENTPLGRVKRQRGGETSADGSSSWEYEIIEITEGENEKVSIGKRKVKDMDE